MSGHGGHGGHENRTETHPRCFAHGFELVHSSALALVGELDDEDAVLGNEADQSDQSHLRIDVHRRRPSVGPERDVRRGHFQKGENQGPEEGQRDRTKEDDEWIAEAVELGGEDQKNKHEGQSKSGKKLVAFRPQLPRFAGVIDGVAGRHDFRRFVLKETQGLVERTDGHAAQLHCVELLEAVERTRLGRLLHRGYRTERHKSSVGTGNVNALELVGIESSRALDLRNDLVAAAADVETVDIITADHGGNVLADLTEIQPEGGHLVAVDEEFDLRLVDLGVDDRREGEHAAGRRFLLQRAGDLEDLLGLGRRGNDEFDGEVTAARQGGRSHRTDANAGNPVQFGGKSGPHLVRRALAFAPRREAHTAEAG